MKLLIFGLLNHQHIQNFASSLKSQSDIELYGINNNPNYNSTFDVYNKEIYNKHYNVKRIHGRLDSVYKLISALSCLIKSLRYKIDIIQFHYVSLFVLPLLIIVKIKGVKSSVFVYGSDYLGTGKIYHIYLKLVFFLSDFIVSDSTTLANRIKEENPQIKNKVKAVLFGSVVIDRLSEFNFSREYYKEKLGFPANLKLVTCGYNGVREQNHIKIIESCLKYGSSSCIFLLPLTYGCNIEYKNELVLFLERNKLNYRILDRFLPDIEWCEYTAATDIFIHMQDSDAFSSSLAEHLFMGNAVINAEWLKYEDLILNGIEYQSANFDSLSTTFKNVLDNLCEVHISNANNKDKIFKLKSLNYCVANYWVSYFNQIVYESN